MRAVVHTRYGPPEVLRVEQVDRPMPRRGELLVRVHATTVNRTDCGFRRAQPFLVRPFSGWFRPRHRILGTEFAGVVEATGPGVSLFDVGDRVFGLNENRFGTHAEYVCVPEAAPVTTIPWPTTFEDAAAVCDGAVLALTYLRAVHAGPGRRVLVYGATGSIGTAAVQLGRHLGAEVTAVCDPAGVEVVRSLGADRVVDRSRVDVTATGETWDVVLDAVGKCSFLRWRRVVRDGGIFTSTDLGPWWTNPVLALVTRWVGRRRVLFPLPRATKADVELVARLLASGEYRAVIDRRLPLSAVVEATRYVESERKVGNVVLVVAGD